MGSHFRMHDGDVHGRHAGDLGNVHTDVDGNVDVRITTRHVSLVPGSKAYVVGRSVVLHELTDDLGLGGDAESEKTGNAGARIACGVIGLM